MAAEYSTLLSTGNDLALSESTTTTAVEEAVEEESEVIDIAFDDSITQATYNEPSFRTYPDSPYQISEDGLTLKIESNNNHRVSLSIPIEQTLISSGKYYWETEIIACTEGESFSCCVGVGVFKELMVYLGQRNIDRGLFNGGRAYSNGSYVNGTGFATGNILRNYLDMDNGAYTIEVMQDAVSTIPMHTRAVGPTLSAEVKNSKFRPIATISFNAEIRFIFKESDLLFELPEDYSIWPSFDPESALYNSDEIYDSGRNKYVLAADRLELKSAHISNPRSAHGRINENASMTGTGKYYWETSNLEDADTGNPSGEGGVGFGYHPDITIRPYKGAKQWLVLNNGSIYSNNSKNVVLTSPFKLQLHYRHYVDLDAGTYHIDIDETGVKQLVTDQVDSTLDNRPLFYCNTGRGRIQFRFASADLRTPAPKGYKTLGNSGPKGAAELDQANTYRLNDNGVQITVSDDNLTATANDVSSDFGYGNGTTIDESVVTGSGKYYWETTLSVDNVGPNRGTGVGVYDPTAVFTGQRNTHWSLFNFGRIYHGGSVIKTIHHFESGLNGPHIRHYLDLDAGTYHMDVGERNETQLVDDGMDTNLLYRPLYTLSERNFIEYRFAESDLRSPLPEGFSIFPGKVLEAVSNDLEPSSLAELVLVTNTEGLAEKLQQLFKLQAGSCLYDLQAGFAWEKLLGSTNSIHYATRIRNKLNENPFVVEVLELNVVFNTHDRTVAVSFKVATTLGAPVSITFNTVT